MVKILKGGITQLTVLYISHIFKRLCTYFKYFESERGNFHLNFSSINVYKRPDDGSQLQPKHAAVNKLTKLVMRLILTHTYEISIFLQADYESLLLSVIPTAGCRRGISDK